ncbi:MAG TPA: hypothetical protein VMD09_11215 [Solirubrobacteraceae bacterium]|nr:hypothetical protein [Solirubrobacteraceae bacterium]
MTLDRAARARWRKGDALGEETLGTRTLGRSEEVVCPFGTDPIVATHIEGDPLHVVREVGQLVHDQVGGERRHHLGEP